MRKQLTPAEMVANRKKLDALGEAVIADAQAHPEAYDAAIRNERPRRHRHVLTETVGNDQVHLIDEMLKGRRVVGVEIDGKVSEEVKDILERPMGEDMQWEGFTHAPDWRGDPWIKDAPLRGKAGIAARYQAEERWQEVVDQKRQEEKETPRTSRGV